MEKNLHKYKKNYYSQNGEDGVINEILKRISNKNKKLNIIEFGAVDGKIYSNTFQLIKQKNIQNAIYIEADKNHFSKLYELSKSIPEIKPINCFVDYKDKSENTLDKILVRNNFNYEYDILSIDVDSYDLDIYRSIKKYHPKLLIIEAGRQSYGILSEHSMDNQLNSFSSIHQVISKKYYLIFYNGNMFYLNKNYFSLSEVKEKFYLDNKLHYQLHRLYYNYIMDTNFKKFILNMLPKNKILIEIVIKLIEFKSTIIDSFKKR